MSTLKEINKLNTKNDNNMLKVIDLDNKTIYLNKLRSLKIEKLLEISRSMNIVEDKLNQNNNLKNELLFAILRQAGELEYNIIAEGILDVINESFGFLRYSETNYVFSSEDIYISQNQIKKLFLRAGDTIKCTVRLPKKNEKYISMHGLVAVNNYEGSDLQRKLQIRPSFDDLTPTYPKEKFNFDNNISTRCIDLISPMGKGQRSLIVAPPRTGKTVLLQNIAHVISENHPEIHLIVLLIGERPEEVTDMRDSVKGDVIYSTFDQMATRHAQIAELVINKAKRMVEQKKDVMILLDSITRLARAYNVVAPSSGKVLTGGIDSNALHKPKSFFGAARNLREGGSLTIIATALNDMGGSKMDEFIFEEFKGTGNMEINLDRRIADKRIYPALDPVKSGTRREELLLDKSILHKYLILRRLIAQMSSAEAMDFLLDKVRNSDDNEDLFSKMNN